MIYGMTTFFLLSTALVIVQLARQTSLVLVSGVAALLSHRGHPLAAGMATCDLVF